MTPLTTKRIGVLMGGGSSEREISLKSGGAIAAALGRRGYQVVMIDVDRGIAHRLREDRVAIAFLALHGSGGEDGTIQGLLETLRIPYTGSGVLASAIGMNKGITKKILVCHSIRTPRCFYRWRNDEEMEKLPHGFDYPVVVKPPNQGSTIGVSIVRESGELLPAQALAFRYSPEILVEEFIEGLEITVGILGESALPVIEILPQEGFYTYEAKYRKGKTEYILPARLEASVYREVQEMAVAACQAIGCEGGARVDFRVNPKGVPFVLEINTIPGMTETSLYPKAAAQAGIDYDTLVERILESALKREKEWG